MNDVHHIWNDGTPITTEKQACGCHITSDVYELCMRGRDLGKSVDGWWNVWQAQKDSTVDPVIIRSFRVNFQTHRSAYLQHLETGADWVL